MSEVSIEDQIKCVEREIQFRKRVYGRLIEQNKMTLNKALHESKTMKAVLETLKEAQPRLTKQPELF